MPSIQDVADQVNAKLDEINQNTADQVSAANRIKTDIDTTNSRLSNISQGLFQITEHQKVEISYLDHLRRQNDTIICLLENNNALLCGMTRKFTGLLDLSAKTLAKLDKIEGIAERTHAAAAGDYDRLAALKAQAEACCPPEQPKLEPCPPACPTPPFRILEPKDTGWKPLPAHSQTPGLTIAPG